MNDVYTYAIGAKNALDWCKSTHHDGIVYAFKSGPDKLVSATDIGFTRFTGPNSEACLQQISERYKNKRARNQQQDTSIAVDEYGKPSKLRILHTENPALPDDLPAAKRLVQKLALEGRRKSGMTFRAGHRAEPPTFSAHRRERLALEGPQQNLAHDVEEEL